MERTRATFIRWVLPHESMEDLVQEAKALTFEHYCEFALLMLQDGRRVLVRGGTFGIDLDRSVPNDPYGRPPECLYVDVEEASEQVSELVFHTHPKPTGPSDDDLMVMKLLGQDRSWLYELFGPAEGTLIRPKRE